MKAAKVLLVTLMTALVACSNGGGGKGNGGGEMPDLKPGLKPTNAVSKEDLQYYSNLLKKSQSFLPGDAAIFQVILKGANAENVQSEDRDEALAKLDAVGMGNINKIKFNCGIGEAQSKTTGDQEFKVGAVSYTDGHMEINDNAERCPMLLAVDANQRSTIRSLSPVGNNGARVVTYVEANETRKQSIQDTGWMYALQAVSFDLSMTTTGTVETVFANESMSMKADMAGTGTMAMELMQYDYVRGPISFNMKLDSAAQAGSMQALYDLQTSRGAIRIVMMGDQTSQSIYINGEKMAPGQLPGLTSLVPAKMSLPVK